VETYRKGLLKAAVTGELTADWRRDNPPQETGEQLLQRILTDRRARWQADPKNARKKYTEPAEPDTDGLPELPEG
jgi:type I restriction enzyme S subunit